MGGYEGVAGYGGYGGFHFYGCNLGVVYPVGNYIKSIPGVSGLWALLA